MQYTNLTFLFLLLFCASFKSFALEQAKLVFALDLVRHGDRTPTETIPSMPYIWSEDLGQLTPKGMQQEYELGVKLRKKYVEDHHLLPQHYRSEALYVRSTNFDRTLMSAQALLMGLYPLGTGPNLPYSTKFALPQGFQPIPIHSKSVNEDDELNIDHKSEKFEQLMKKYIFTTQQWHDKNSMLKPKYARWSKATGAKITDLYHLKSIGNTLSIYQLYQAPLPPGLTIEDVNEIIDASNWVFTARFKSQEVGEALGKGALETIIQYLQTAASQNSPLKYVLLSAHDLTIAAVLSAMKCPLNEPPPYAADLNFSLFKTSSGNYYVEVTYNDQPLIIPACQKTTCSLAQLG